LAGNSPTHASAALSVLFLTQIARNIELRRQEEAAP
jgi:hypothetical protein